MYNYIFLFLITMNINIFMMKLKFKRSEKHNLNSWLVSQKTCEFDANFHLHAT